MPTLQEEHLLLEVHVGLPQPTHLPPGLLLGGGPVSEGHQTVEFHTLHSASPQGAFPPLCPGSLPHWRPEVCLLLPSVVACPVSPVQDPICSHLPNLPPPSDSC